jgi:hypothetical protein
MDADLQDNPEEIPEFSTLLRKRIMILFPVGKEKDMILFLLKIYLPNYLMLLPERPPE